MTKTLLIVLALLSTALSNVALAQTPPPPTIEYYHLDAVGSVRAVTNETGQVVRQHHYFPFGEEYLAQGGNDPRRFTGKERDAETGLDYFGARHYASRTGRFTTVDPVVPIEDALLDPQRWNRYTYVMNRPLVLTDPDGRCPSCFVLLQRAAEMAQRVASSPAVQRAQQAIVNQGSRAWIALTRLFNTPKGQELVQTAAELTTGADLGPMSALRAPNIGAVIGHYNAGYAKVGRELGVAVFDIPADIWNRMTPDQQLKANQAFLDGIIGKRLTIQVVTNGSIKLNSTLQWEIEYLLGKGYTWSKGGDMLLPPMQ